MSPSTPSVMAGRTVLVTADRRQEDLADALRRRGATVRCVPAMSTVDHADDETLLARTRELLDARPDVLVVTTGVGFRGWLAASRAAGLGDELLAVLGGTRVLVRGAKAKGAVVAEGLTPAWVAASETTEEITEHLLAEGVRGARVAVQHHGRGSDGLDEALRSAGADVVPFVVYRWGPAPDPEALTESVRSVAAGEIDAVLFTSAPAVRAWLAAADEAAVWGRIVGLSRSGALVLGAVGPTTAAPLREREAVPLVPDRSRMGALVRAVIEHYEHEGDRR